MAQHDSLISMMAQLIKLPSMSSVSPEFDHSNRAVIDLLATWFEELGFSIKIDPLPNQPHKANLLAHIGPLTANSQGLMLAGHTDTVPYDAQYWQFDPFTLREKEQRLYGLGTTDMKGFFALIIEALKEVDLQKLKHPLFILATADEESTMEGAIALAKQGCPYVSHAVIGEPTDLKPVRAHKGIMMEALRLVGHAGHSSNPALGTNALEAMHLAIADILQWRAELQAKYRDDHFDVPVPTLNLGHIHGGDNPNRICEACELHFDLRPVPGMSIEELREQFHQRMGHLFHNNPIKWETHSLAAGTPAMSTDKDAAIVKASEHCCSHIAQTAAFCTEGPYLSQLGIDTIILGPGNIAQAHQPDEYLALASINPMVKILRQLIHQFCFRNGKQ